MSKIVALPITCPCKEKKKFKYPVQLTDKSNGTPPLSLQIDCPFSYEENCIKHLTIQLPPGVSPINDENILRGS